MKNHAENSNIKGDVSLVELDLQERKEALLMLTKRVVEILEAHNLDVFAYYGTLLGCVRHQGFIPWDDDVDLAMSRPDYNMLGTIDWGRYGLEIISPRISKYCPYAFTKIVDDNWIVAEEVDSPHKATGLNIDIFPIDVCEDPVPRARLGLIYFLKRLIEFKVVKLNRVRDRFRNAVLAVGKTTLTPFNVGFFTRLVDALAQKGTGMPKLAGCLGGPYRRREIVKMEVFGELVEKNFENIKLKAPKRFDCILTSLYGNYMELPPVEKRKVHAVSVFRRTCD